MKSGKQHSLNMQFMKIMVIFLALLIPVLSTAGDNGILINWEISRAFSGDFDLAQLQYPRFFQIFSAQWQKETADKTGMVNISKIRKTTPPCLVFARNIFISHKRRQIKLSFTFSDEAALFLNNKKLFQGKAAKDSPDETVNLTLEKGLNEIFFMVKSRGTSWGIKCKTNTTLETPHKDHNRLTKVWETEPLFMTPESVIYDEKRDLLYVSSFDVRFNPRAEKPEQFTGFISKVNMKGEIITLRWIDKLHAPCGMGIYNDKLYTVERNNLTEIDIKEGKVLKRYPVAGTDFLNDLVIDKRGTIYMSDTTRTAQAKGRIFRFINGKIELWYEGFDVSRLNGIYMNKNKLLLGNTGDGRFKSMDPVSKKVVDITSLGAGVVDGIQVDHKGNYLVSHWEGQIFSISPDGDVTELIDTMPQRLNTADFKYVKEKKLLIIPTFLGNKVTAYKMN